MMFPLNVVYATLEGDIGYHMTGLFPKRKYGVPHGVYPKKGWLKANQWEGFVSGNELPYVVNPKEGYIVSSNNFATSPNFKHGVT